jgi:hypothetical protein
MWSSVNLYKRRLLLDKMSLCFFDRSDVGHNSWWPESDLWPIGDLSCPPLARLPSAAIQCGRIRCCPSAEQRGRATFRRSVRTTCREAPHARAYKLEKLRHSKYLSRSSSIKERSATTFFHAGDPLSIDLRPNHIDIADRGFRNCGDQD